MPLSAGLSAPISATSSRDSRENSFAVRSRASSTASSIHDGIASMSVVAQGGGAGQGGVGSVGGTGTGGSSIYSNNPNNRVSEAITYGPKFIEVYELFEQHIQQQSASISLSNPQTEGSSGLAGMGKYPIDLHRHLLCLCLDYMVPFVKWARQSEQHICKLSKMLFHYDYLRPEVRNGIAVILIYTFAAKKAVLLNEQEVLAGKPPLEPHDMFTVLSSPEYGLGITNKLTLRIYADPWQYFNFIKLVITALIDCGFLPDNERVNVTNRMLPLNTTKVKKEDVEEFQAFLDMKRVVTNELDNIVGNSTSKVGGTGSNSSGGIGSGIGSHSNSNSISGSNSSSNSNEAARKLITTISTFWYENKKQVSIIFTICFDF